MTSRNVRFVAAATLTCLLAIGLRPAPTAAQAVCDQTARFPRPVPLGVSGGNINLWTAIHQRAVCASGTLGALVEDAGGLYVLSNNHVIGLSNAAHVGDLITQPGLVDKNCKRTPGDSVAFFSRLVKIRFARKRLNTVDAAIAILRPGNTVDPEIANIGFVAGTTVPPTIGLHVQKMGRTTCLTEGMISAIGVNASVGYERLRGKVRPANFINQIMIGGGGFAGPGDSGSLVLTKELCPQAVGLLFAGSASDTLANPIADVLSGLGVSMVGKCIATTASGAPSVTTLAENIGVSSAVASSAAAVRDRHNAQLMKVPGAVGTGIGQGDQPNTAEIQLYVNQMTPEAQSAAPTSLDGVPVRVIETGEFRAY